MSRRGTRLRRLGRATYFDCGRMKWPWQRVRFRLNVQCLELALEAGNISPLSSLGGRDPVIFRAYAGSGDAKQVISFALPTLV